MSLWWIDYLEPEEKRKRHELEAKKLQKEILEILDRLESGEAK